MGRYISDQFRARQKDTASTASTATTDGVPVDSPLERIADHSETSFESIWEKEWQENVMKAAIERVKMKVSPKQFQIFDYNVIRGMKPIEVHRKLGVSIAQVYLAKHRVGAVLNKEIQYIRAQEQ